MRRIGSALAVAALAFCGAASAARADRPVILELFTSEGCSSCPPADAVLRDLARTRADVLPLAFHVTYWDYLGWHDPFALQAATQRQRAYAAALPSDVYTPQLVVDGRTDVVGSDRPATLAAIRRAASADAAAVPVTLRRDGNEAVIEIAAGTAAPGTTVLLVGYDPEHTTSIGRGENGGRTLVEANIVRSLATAAAWSGDRVTLRRPLPAGEKLAVVIQASDGRILGAARESEHAS
ncbi:MAG TPA: DUF1223 domain-containing protein [Acetobacteraceae bacterium]|jgi:hypothetical protein|nr:DUF1223 domain-containing protein [Acetobacteraceae bacterium]